MRNFLGSCILTAALFWALTAAATASGSVVVDRVVAVVNGEIITLSDLQREEAVKRKTEKAEDKRLLLEDMIDRKLQMAAAKREGMEVTEKELSSAVADIIKRNGLNEKQFAEALAREGLSLDQYKDELREQMTLSRVFNKFVRSGVAVEEAEVRQFYDRNAGSYSEPEEIRVRQMFFKLPDNATPSQTAAVREKAASAMARAEKGEDFARLVRELSESENASSGGDLGFMQRGEAVDEIEEATRNLKPGEMAGPILYEGGFHVFRLEEVRTPVKPYEKVKEEITRMLYEQKMENMYRTWLQTLRSDSTIENKL